MDTIKLIEHMLAKPYLFTGGEDLTALKYFQFGYDFCLASNMILNESPEKYSLLPADWRLFTEFIRCSLTYDEPKADWYDILMTYFGNKEGYRMFVNYFDNFRRLEIRSYKRAMLTDEQQQAFVKITGLDKYPTVFYAVELADGAGWLSAYETDSVIYQRRHFFKDESALLEDARSLFESELNWFSVTGVSELNFKKPVRLELNKISK